MHYFKLIDNSLCSNHSLFLCIQLTLNVKWSRFRRSSRTWMKFCPRMTRTRNCRTTKQMRTLQSIQMSLHFQSQKQKVSMHLIHFVIQPQSLWLSSLNHAVINEYIEWCCVNVVKTDAMHFHNFLYWIRLLPIFFCLFVFFVSSFCTAFKQYSVCVCIFMC